jgi:DNA-directed RNA polymerase specialized sigma subunit
MSQDNYISMLNDVKNSLINSKFFLSSDKFENNNKELINQMEDLIKQIDLKLKSECNHEYIEDYVDITPEKSQKICYCNKCYSCFPVN